LTSTTKRDLSNCRLRLRKRIKNQKRIQVLKETQNLVNQNMRVTMTMKAIHTAAVVKQHQVLHLLWK